MDFLASGLEKLDAKVKEKSENKNKNDAEALETAYLIIKDCKEGEPQTVTPAKTKSILETIASTLKDMITPAQPKQDNKTIKVQFNPTSLQFQTESAVKNAEKASIDKKGNGDVESVQETKNGNKLSVSMTLIFDSTTDKKGNVKSFVDSFIVLVKNPYIRQITFCWGKLYYQGIVDGINAQYVQFNESGVPTRAKVDLKLKLL